MIAAGAAAFFVGLVLMCTKASAIGALLFLAGVALILAGAA